MKYKKKQNLIKKFFEKNIYKKNFFGIIKL